MGVLAKIIGRKKPPQTVEYIAAADEPGLVTTGDFGIVCGFDLNGCPYTVSNGRKVPMLAGANRERVIADCAMIERAIESERASIPSMPQRFDKSFRDADSITLEIRPKTPKGREPKYPAVVRLEARDPIIRPANWDEWIDAYVASHGGDAVVEAYESETAPPPPAVHRDSSLVAELKYLPDGSLGAADATFWQERIGFSFAVRSIGGTLRLSKAKRTGDDGCAVIFEAN